MPSPVLGFTKRIDLKMLLETTCKDAFGFSPVVKDSLQGFEDALKETQLAKVFVIDAPADRAEFNGVLQKLLVHANKSKTILVLTGTELNMPNFKCFAPEDIQALIDHMVAVLKTTEPMEPKLEEFISIPVNSFIHFKVVPFDLFIKMPSGKFIKRIPAHEDIDETTVTVLISRGITDLYFEKKFNTDFSRLLVNNMINKVEKVYESRAEQLKATNEVFLTTKEIVQSVGLPSRVIAICESVMGSIEAEVHKNKDKFSTYLNSIQGNSELSFGFRFIELTSYIATQMLSEITNDPEQIKTVVFSAFFCDIALKESFHLDYRTDYSIKDIWPDEKKDIFEHALRASEIVAKYKNAPKEASLVIKQHHGSPDGKGFPSVIPTNLSPLSKCLIAAQELAFALLKKPEVAPPTVLKWVMTKFDGTPLDPYFQNFKHALESAG